MEKRIDDEGEWCAGKAVDSSVNTSMLSLPEFMKYFSEQIYLLPPRMLE